MSFNDLWHYGLGLSESIIPNSVYSTYMLLAPILCAVIAYLIGSFNFSLLISSRKGDDVRNYGSGNAGATNMMRVYGKKYAYITFLGDFLKAVLVCFIARILYGDIGAYIAGLFCIIGHAFPLYFNFKGGKGVSVFIGFGLMTEPILALILVLVWAAILFGFKMVSLASVMVAIVYPFALYMWYKLIHNQEYGLWFVFAFLIGCAIVFLHRQNLVRIFNHTEHKFKFKKKEKKASGEEITEAVAEEKGVNEETK